MATKVEQLAMPQARANLSTGNDRTGAVSTGHASAVAHSTPVMSDQGRSIARMFTYFIQRECGGPIKIGKTGDIKHRLRSLQSALPETLVCIAFFEGDGMGWPKPIVVTDPPYLTDETGITHAIPGVSSRVTPTHVVGMPWGYSLDWVDAVTKFDPSHWVVFASYHMLADIQGAVGRIAKLGCTFVWRKINAPRMTRPVPRKDCEFIVWARHPKAGCGRMGLFESMVIDIPMPQAGWMADERILEPGTGKAMHPCQKPIAVVQPFIDRLCGSGDLVLDPFMGTGTTLLAAKLVGVRAVGIEIEERYCEIAANRLAQGVLWGAEGVSA